MPTSGRPTDLITTHAASKIAERSERTIRRWAHPTTGKLQRWLGEPAVIGGAAPILVSKQDLMNLLTSSEQEPRTKGVKLTLDTTETTSDIPPSDMRSAPTDTRIAVLEERLKTAQVATDLATARAECDGLARQLDSLREQVSSLQDQVASTMTRSDNAHEELRSDLDAERDRTRALEAELRALRGLQGGSWWQKLLGGPAAPALEAK